MARRRFNKNQKRDSRGRWTAGAGSKVAGKNERRGRAIGAAVGTLIAQQRGVAPGVAILKGGGTGAYIGGRIGRAVDEIQGSRQKR